MKVTLALITLLGFLLFEEPVTNNQLVVSQHSGTLKSKAFKVLDSKCNVCHRKQNPFMVFSLKNMEKRARKIYTQVFEKKRMPKGNDIKLTQEEYSLLENWLDTQLTN
ncbi:hypothetical protein [Ekhidna sp.]|uniref:hypothetical protein n=1 Tax=Ekhidna sp. TaxID=2608089 RepID=UPI003B5A74F4